MIQNPAVGMAMDTDPRVSSSTSLHNAQNLLLLLLYHLSTTYLYIVVDSSEGQEAGGPLCVYSQPMLCSCGLASGCPLFLCSVPLNIVEVGRTLGVLGPQSTV